MYFFSIALREYEKIVALEIFESITAFMTWRIAKGSAVKTEQTQGSLYY